MKGAAAIILLLLASGASAFGTTPRHPLHSMRPQSNNIIGLGNEILSDFSRGDLSVQISSVISEKIPADTQDRTNSDLSKAVTGAVDPSISAKKVGERGEAFLLAQGALILFIVLGGIPVINDWMSMIVGPTLIALGLGTMILSGKELGGSLSHWAVPIEESEGGDGLITSGVYSQIRHPMYTGLLTATAGIAVVTNSAARLALTFALFYVLDRKASHEEKALAEAYSDYDDYTKMVTGKIIPSCPMVKHIE
jgi:protein-S-isoprenylcysteine O-methyltransferase Ste14